MKVRTIVLALVIAIPAAAHHSAAAIYVMDKTVTVEGDVTRFSLGNPHMRIYFTRSDQADRTTEWVAEGGSRTVLSRRGWTQETVRPGDHIVLLANPAHDERAFVHVQQITLPDGRKLATEDFDPSSPVLKRPAAEQGAAQGGK